MPHWEDEGVGWGLGSKAAVASEWQRELGDFWLGTGREARGKGRCEKKQKRRTEALGSPPCLGSPQTC